MNIGININDSSQPFTEQILNGEKTIETRNSINNALQSYIGQRVGIVRTGVGNTKVVGYATIGNPIHYTSEKQFRADEDKHLVKKGSPFDIKDEKYGYPLLDVKRCLPYTPFKVSIKTSVLRQPQTFKEFYLDEGEEIVTFYHATEASNIPRIKREGLKYGTMTSDKNDALRYADLISKTNVPVKIVEIKIKNPSNKFRIQIGEDYPDGLKLTSDDRILDYDV